MTFETSADRNSSTSVQAVVLAAGFAKRMQPLSNDCHKALLSVGGTTILGRIMDNLGHAGINDVTIVTGYRADDVKNFVAEHYPQFAVSYVHNENFRTTNNIVSLSMAFDAMTFDQDVVLIECDLLFDPTLLDRLLANPGTNVALLDRYRTGMDGTVVEVANGFVTEVYTGDAQGADFSYVEKYKTLNIYKFDKDFCRNAFRPMLHTYANDIDGSIYYEVILGMLANIRAHRISAEIVEGERWAEVDDPNDLAVASFAFEPTQRSAILDRTFGGHWNFPVMDFSFMRNAYFPTGPMMAAMRHALPELLADYGSAQPMLNEKLSYFLKCDQRRLQVLHGASQIFPMMPAHYAGATVAIPSASFGEYARWFPDATVYPDAPGIDWATVSQLASQVDLMVLVNPNTSTGTTMSSQAIYDLAAATPNTTFWVDESFLAFSDEPPMVRLLEERPLDNVVVLVSLSKSLGVPGVRLGYVYSPNLETIAAFGAQLPVWNLSSIAEYLVELMLKFTPAYERSLQRTAQDRDALREQLLALPLVHEILPSGGNFLLLTLVGEEADLAARVRDALLQHHNIEVKNVTEKFSDRRPRLRVAVRARGENNQFVAALSNVDPSA